MALVNRQSEAEEARGALERALARDDFQTELPRREVPEVPDLTPLARILEVVFWVVLVAVALVLGTLLVRALIERRGRRARIVEDASEEEAQRLAGADLRVDMAQLEALAEAGRFGEALHLLLLATFRALCDLAEIDLKSSWTSREIVARIPLPGEAREALRDLVRVVEVSHFGFFRPGPEDWRRALGRFEDFVRILRESRR